MKHFVRKPEEYRRDLNPIRDYSRNSAAYIQKMSGGRDASVVERFLKARLDPETGDSVKVPQVRVLVRGENGDRKDRLMRFDHFLDDVQAKRRIIAPTMTVYENPDVKKSILGEYLGNNLLLRKIAKKEKFEADMAGDKIRKAIKDAEQNTLKIKNNSMSGAHSSPHTILFNKSSHSTLTSTCRMATSYGNANNEKLLCGNRHYWSPNIVRENIISVINNTDLDAIERVAKQFHLRAPTVEETMAGIRRSTEPYWRHDGEMARIATLVQALDDRERMAFLFVGDFYHTAQINPEFAREFIQWMSTKATVPMVNDVELRKSWIKQMCANTEAFISIVCMREINGRQFKDVAVDSDEMGYICQTIKQVIETLDRYQPFIRAFWVTDNMPASVYWMPSIVRQGAITSDTDSTIFTVQYWPEWYHGRAQDFSDESIAVANTLVFFSAESIRHILALFSANLGANVKEIHRLSMKNEYYFPVFCLTSRAKHYFAWKMAQEGNVFKKMQPETKGVGLRSSNTPPSINAQCDNLEAWLMDEIMAGRKLKIRQVLRAVAKIENEISESIRRGQFELLSSQSIKTRETYTNPESSNWLYSEMWEAVFAPKYGAAPPLPYVAIKVSLTTDNRTRFREWIRDMPDRELAARMQAWAESRNKKEMGTMFLPHSNLMDSGIPEELIPAANIRGLIALTMTPFYIVLETLGIFMKNKNNTRLVCDDAWLLAEDWPLPELDLVNYGKD